MADETGPSITDENAPHYHRAYELTRQTIVDSGFSAPEVIASRITDALIRDGHLRDHATVPTHDGSLRVDARVAQLRAALVERGNVQWNELSVAEINERRSFGSGYWNATIAAVEALDALLPHVARVDSAAFAMPAMAAPAAASPLAESDTAKYDALHDVYLAAVGVLNRGSTIEWNDPLMRERWDMLAAQAGKARAALADTVTERRRDEALATEVAARGEGAKRAAEGQGPKRVEPVIYVHDARVVERCGIASGTAERGDDVFLAGTLEATDVFENCGAQHCPECYRLAPLGIDAEAPGHPLDEGVEHAEHTDGKLHHPAAPGLPLGSLADTTVRKVNCEGCLRWLMAHGELLPLYPGDVAYLSQVLDRLDEVKANAAATPTLPRVGDPVHYRSYGTPGGEYVPECRAATVTGVPDRAGYSDAKDGLLDLLVMTPQGIFHNRVPRDTDDAEERGVELHGGTWHFPEGGR